MYLQTQMNENQNKLTYINENGEEVYTSTYLQNRGTCCRSNCTHCPYDFTLKNYSIEMKQLEEEQIKLANMIIRDSRPVELCSITASILSNGFGKERVTEYHVTLDNIQNFAIARFKDQVCGVVEFSTKLSESSAGRSIKELFLKKEFQNQGLNIGHINR